MGQSDLVYSFAEVKKLYDEYSIKKDKDGNLLVVERGSGAICTDQDPIDKVKFAHTWVQATRYGRPKNFPNQEKITQEDYSYAFDTEAKEIYDFIMESVSQTMLASRSLLRKEPLMADVLKADLRAHAEDTVSGLYSNERFLAAFNKWVRACNNIPVNSEGLRLETQEKVSTYW